MLAVDTNVLVRFLTGDDPVQAGAARRVIESNPIHVSTTVLLETEWVLRKTYGFAAFRVGEALRRFIGLPTVDLENEGVVVLALDWLQQGMDFADALHLASATHCESFLTFDRKFIKLGRSLSGLDVRSP